MTCIKVNYPVKSSEIPTTALSEQEGCKIRADSISAVLKRCPDTLITSNTC